MLYKDITPKEHGKKCPKFPLGCLSENLGCRKRLIREDLEAHVKTCPFHQIRSFLKMKQLQFDKVKLQMLTIQKSEMLVRKEHLEAIVNHQKLLGKYQTLYKDHVLLMENWTTKERDRLLLMKKSRGTEAKYIKLSEQFILLGERNKKLQEHILATDQELSREAIKTAMSENRSKEFNRLLRKFIGDAKVQYQLQHADLLSSYKSFLSIHKERIKGQFENMLNKSGELFVALYGDVYKNKKDAGMLNAMRTLKDDDFNFLRQYQEMMSNQVTGVSKLFSGFINKHMGIQEKQLGMLSSFFGLKDNSSEKDEDPNNIFETIDLRNVAPPVLRSYNINQLEQKIKLLEGLRDGATPITEEILRNAFENEPVLAVIDPPESPTLDTENEVKVSADDEAKPEYEVNPSLRLNMNEFRLRLLPSAPDFDVNLNMLDLGTVPPQPLEDEKEPIAIPRQQLPLTDEKEEVDEKEPVNLSSQPHPNTLPEPSEDLQINRTNSSPLNTSDLRNQIEHESGDRGLDPVDVGLGIAPVMLDPMAVARALQEGSRRLLGIRNEADAKSEEVD